MAKIKVMLVDDEVIVIEDLKTLIDWEEHGFEIVAEASNGRKALELFKQQQPQVIFTDIRMPVMDGLEFSRQIHKLDKSVKIILLTAFKDFEYAKQALEIPVISYLLKYSVNAEALLNELVKVKEVLKHEEKTAQILFQNRLASYFNKRDSLAAVSDSDRLLFAGYGEKFLLWTVRMDAPHPLLNVIENKANIFIDELIQDLELTNLFKAVFPIELNQGQWIVLFYCSRTYNKKEVWDELYPRAVQLQRLVSHTYSQTISIAITTISRPTVELPHTCQRAIKASEYGLFIGKEAIFGLEDIRIHQGGQSSILPDDFEIVEQALKRYDMPAVIAAFNHLAQELKQADWDMQIFNRVCVKLMDILEHFRRKNYVCSIEDLFKSGELNASKWYSFDGIFEWFTEQFRSVIVESEQKRLTNYSRNIQRACTYIHDHYQEEISVEDVAAELSISGVWLSKSFKKETGVTFLDYLTNNRMDKAKELLKISDYKIYEIAERVGYKTSQYFSSVFQKATGMTPHEFKSRKGDLHEK